MKKIIISIVMALTAYLTVSAGPVTDSIYQKPVSIWRNSSGCEHTGPMHTDTNKVEFTRNDKPDAKVLLFTYHKCNAVWYDNLWYVHKNGELYLQRDHIFLKSDPANS